MSKQRRASRKERWRAINSESTGMGVFGVLGKSVAPVGLIVAVIGALVSPVAFAVGAVVTAFAVALWWWAASVMGRSTGVSTGRAMWTIWLVPTWAILFDVLNFFDLFGGWG